MTDEKKPLPDHWLQMHDCAAGNEQYGDGTDCKVSGGRCEKPGNLWRLLHESEARELFDLRESLKGGVVAMRLAACALRQVCNDPSVSEYLKHECSVAEYELQNALTAARDVTDE